MIKNKCGCMVERTNFPVLHEGGKRVNGAPIMEVKYRKCPSCYAYTRKRDTHVKHATVVADQAVPEMRTTMAGTQKREAAAQKWNQIYHSTMNKLCKGL